VESVDKVEDQRDADDQNGQLKDAHLLAVLDHDILQHVGHVLATVDGLFEEVVHFFEFDEQNRVFFFIEQIGNRPRPIRSPSFSRRLISMQCSISGRPASSASNALCIALAQFRTISASTIMLGGIGSMWYDNSRCEVSSRPSSTLSSDEEML